MASNIKELILRVRADTVEALQSLRVVDKQIGMLVNKRKATPLTLFEVGDRRQLGVLQQIQKLQDLKESITAKLNSVKSGGFLTDSNQEKAIDRLEKKLIQVSETIQDIVAQSQNLSRVTLPAQGGNAAKEKAAVRAVLTSVSEDVRGITAQVNNAFKEVDKYIEIDAKGLQARAQALGISDKEIAKAQRRGELLNVISKTEDKIFQQQVKLEAFTSRLPDLYQQQVSSLTLVQKLSGNQVLTKQEEVALQKQLNQIKSSAAVYDKGATKASEELTSAENQRAKQIAAAQKIVTGLNGDYLQQAKSLDLIKKLLSGQTLTLEEQAQLEQKLKAIKEANVAATANKEKAERATKDAAKQNLDIAEKQKIAADQLLAIEQRIRELRAKGVNLGGLQASQVKTRAFNITDPTAQNQQLDSDILTSAQKVANSQAIMQEAMGKTGNAVSNLLRRIFQLNDGFGLNQKKAYLLRRELIDLSISLSLVTGSRALGGIGFLLSSLQSAFGKISATILAVVAAITAIVKSIKTFSESEVQIAQLSAALGQFGKSGKSVLPEFRKLAQEAAKFGSTQAEALGAANDFIASTGSMAVSLRALSAATKIAAADSVDLQTAVSNVNTILAGRIPLSFNRFVSVIRQSRVELDKAASIDERMELIEKAISSIAAQAEATPQTIKGTWKQIVATFNNLLTAFGEFLEKFLPIKLLLIATLAPLEALKDIFDFLANSKIIEQYINIPFLRLQKIVYQLQLGLSNLPLIGGIIDKEKLRAQIDQVSDVIKQKVTELNRNNGVGIVDAFIGDRDAFVKRFDDALKIWTDIIKKAQIQFADTILNYQKEQYSREESLLNKYYDIKLLKARQNSAESVAIERNRLKALRELKQSEVRAEINTINIKLKQAQKQFQEEYDKAIRKIKEFADPTGSQSLRELTQQNIDKIAEQKLAARNQEASMTGGDAIARAVGEQFADKVEKSFLGRLIELTFRDFNTLVRSGEAKGINNRNPFDLKRTPFSKVNEQLFATGQVTEADRIQAATDALEAFYKKIGTTPTKLAAAKNDLAELAKLLADFTEAASKGQARPEQATALLEALKAVPTSDILVNEQDAAKLVDQFAQFLQIILTLSSKQADLNALIKESGWEDEAEGIKSARAELEDLNYELEKYLKNLDVKRSKVAAELAGGQISRLDAAQQNRAIDLQQLDRLKSDRATYDLKLQTENLFSEPDQQAIADYTQKIAELDIQINNLIASLNNLDAQASAGAIGVGDAFVGGMQRAADAAMNFQEAAVNVGDTIVKSTADFAGAFVADIGAFIDGTKDAGEAFKQFLSDMLKSIAQFLAQQAILNIFKGIFGVVGGAFSGASSATGSVANYTGPLTITGGGLTFPKHGGVELGKGRRQLSFATGGVAAPWTALNRPRTADDRYPVLVRGGEGFIRPEAVDWLGGKNAIHAINQLRVPRDIFRNIVISAPKVTPMRFASGGITEAMSSMSAPQQRGASDLNVNVVNVIKPENIRDIGQSSEMQKAFKTFVVSNPDLISSVANKSSRFGSR